jgi:hypothetical protein
VKPLNKWTAPLVFALALGGDAATVRDASGQIPSCATKAPNGCQAMIIDPQPASRAINSTASLHVWLSGPVPVPIPLDFPTVAQLVYVEFVPNPSPAYAAQGYFEVRIPMTFDRVKAGPWQVDIPIPALAQAVHNVPGTYPLQTNTGLRTNLTLTAAVGATTPTPTTKPTATTAPTPTTKPTTTTAPTPTTKATCAASQEKVHFSSLSVKGCGVGPKTLSCGGSSFCWESTYTCPNNGIPTVSGLTSGGFSIGPFVSSSVSGSTVKVVAQKAQDECLFGGKEAHLDYDVTCSCRP